MLSREQHDAQEEIYKILLKEVETLLRGRRPGERHHPRPDSQRGRVGCGLHSKSGRGA
jgi:hypothetical protein